MHKRQLTIVGIVLFAGMILFAISSFQQEAQTKKTQVQEEEATVVQEGQLTEKEKEYNKEYKKLYLNRKASKLSEVVEQTKRRGKIQEIGVMIGTPDTISIGNQPVLTSSKFLQKLSCEADAIVIGSAKSKTAHLTEDETFVYTEYAFLVQEVLKNNLVSPIEVNNNIQVTRPGGLIKLDNQIIRAEDLSYEPLTINKNYLLLLRFVPSANGYIVSSPKGDFVIEKDYFKSLSKLEFPSNLKEIDSPSFLSEIHNSITVGCDQNTKGGY